MNPATVVVQALGVAYSAGINLPATVAVLGLVQRAGWVQTLPGGLDVLASWWIITLALVLGAAEFMVTLVPGIASTWETAQSVIRPPAAIVLAVATAYHLDPVYTTAAALLGGGLALTTHGTKLGVRYAVDASPEPVTNFGANVAEITTVTTVCLAVWRHPYVTVGVALAVLVLLVVLVRRVVRAIRGVFGGGVRRAV